MERGVRVALGALTALTALTVLLHAAVMLWARHEFTQVESVVANHSASLTTGHGIYFRLNGYPYTITAYTPIFYALQAGLYWLGVPIFVAGRALSFLALLGVLLVCRGLLRLYAVDRHSIWAGTLLIASIGIVGLWGTVGQVDMLALLWSLAALYSYSQYRLDQNPRRLWQAGLFIILAIFTKQTMIAAPASIALLLAFENRRRAVWFIAAVSLCGLAVVAALNQSTHGGFIESTVLANINPFSAEKLLSHLHYLLAAGGGLLLIAIAGARSAFRPVLQPLFVYLVSAVAVFAATGPKIGSDLNYQLETLIVAGLCAAWSLDRLRFFPRLFQADRSPITLLQIPLLLSVVMNLAISARASIERIGGELLHRSEYTVLQPYLDSARGPVVSVELDPLVQSRRLFEVEPLIYTLLVEAGRINPEPLRQDLARSKFPLVILYEDVFAPRSEPRHPEMPSLPGVQIDEIRKHYRLVRHVPGPFLNGVYVYVPAGS